MTNLVLFTGTMLSAIVGAVIGIAVGAICWGFIGSMRKRHRAAVDEGWALTDLIRGGLWGALPGLVAGGILGFRWLTSWVMEIGYQLALFM